MNHQQTKLERDWNTEPYSSIEGILWDLQVGKLSVRESKKELEKYLSPLQQKTVEDTCRELRERFKGEEMTTRDYRDYEVGEIIESYLKDKLTN